MSYKNVEQVAMLFFEDQECKKPIKLIDWGRPYLGETVSKTVYIRNKDQVWPITNIGLNESIKTTELEVKYPEFLMPGEVAKIEIKLTGAMTRREELQLSHLLVGDLWIG